MTTPARLQVTLGSKGYINPQKIFADVLKALQFDATLVRRMNVIELIINDQQNIEDGSVITLLFLPECASRQQVRAIVSALMIAYPIDKFEFGIERKVAVHSKPRTMSYEQDSHSED